jgi:hypothetical protein
MSDSKLTNIPASVRQKLLNLARERNEDFQLLLTKYGLETVTDFAPAADVLIP